MRRAAATLCLTALGGIQDVRAGDDLAGLLAAALTRSGIQPVPGDVLVIAQKIVSKAEGRMVMLDTITPSARAVEIATRADKDPRLVELILSEASEVMRVRPGVIIVRHRLGLVLANAGIDQSNLGIEGAALLLPHAPDASCAGIRAGLQQHTGCAIGVLIIDSLGRAWRNGTVGTAIGVSGVPALIDLRGQPDLYGRCLQTSELGHADEIAAAASLLMGQAAEGRPAVLVRGLPPPARDGRAQELVRERQLDLFP